MVTAPTARIAWRQSHRIIRTVYPPVWLFEDIADPADWDLIASAEAKTNPRVRDEIGDLALVPATRRVAGPSASIVMGAFTHCSVTRPGRFSQGGYGVWYAGNQFEVALMETIHHHEKFLRMTDEPACESQFRELRADLGGAMRDVRGAGFDDLLARDDYGASQRFALAARDQGADGIVYPSVRWPAGEAVAVFWPDCITLPVQQARHLLYSWDGASVTRFFVYGEDCWYPRPAA
jgi:hypothetical protein